VITHELMRELLNDDLGNIREIAEFVPNEIVYKALIIREFMKERGIENVRQGIREFYTYERNRLQKLGFIPSSESSAGACKSASSACG
jgi:hypothetical protein